MEDEIKELLEILKSHCEFMEACAKDIQLYSKSKNTKHLTNEIVFRSQDSIELINSIKSYIE